MKLRIPLTIVTALAFIAFAGVTLANHSWGGYHWARTSNPFTLKLGDNLSSNWKSFLNTTSTDWSVSSVLDTTIVEGGKDPRRCQPTLGRVEVCNSKYGNNGWLGLAQIWISGTHITQGVTKLNDTYFNTPKYNTPGWRNLVMCQEIGHTFGLGHQDENFTNTPLGTCMDYTSDPAPNQHPNAHDYAQLETIYTHLDSTTTVGQTVKSNGQGKGSVGLENSEEWGKGIKQDSRGKTSLFEKDLGKGNKVFTFIVWAD